VGAYVQAFSVLRPLDYLTGAAGPAFVHHPLNPCSTIFHTANATAPALAFVDAWTAVHGGWPLGTTFPAVLGGNSNDPSRPDRILFRQRLGSVTACDADLLAAPPSAPPLSDHYGVTATFTW